MIRDRVSEVVGAVASCSSVRRFGSSPRLLLFQAGLLAAAACGSGALWAISDGRVSAVELIPAILLPGAVAATLAYKSSCSRLAGILADLMTTALISVAVRVTGGAASEARALLRVAGGAAHLGRRRQEVLGHVDGGGGVHHRVGTMACA